MMCGASYVYFVVYGGKCDGAVLMVVSEWVQMNVASIGAAMENKKHCLYSYKSEWMKLDLFCVIIAKMGFSVKFLVFQFSSKQIRICWWIVMVMLHWVEFDLMNSTTTRLER